MSSDGPVLDTLTDMTTVSVEHNSLSPREFVSHLLGDRHGGACGRLSYGVLAHLLWLAVFGRHFGLGHRDGDAESAQDVPAG